MKIYIIRHLETEYNKKGVLQGRWDIPILAPSAKTRKQINKNKKLLDEVGRFDHILISQLQRTRMTAELYTNEKLAVEPLLDELDFGCYEGFTKEAFLAEQTQWLTNPLSMTLGESLLAFQCRVSQFIQKYTGAKTLLAFGHGAWIRAFLSYVEHGNINKMNSIEVINNQIVLVDYHETGE